MLSQPNYTIVEWDAFPGRYDRRRWAVIANDGFVLAVCHSRWFATRLVRWLLEGWMEVSLPT